MVCFLGVPQNFNVILTQHNPARDKNVHFIVSPKMSAKDRIIVAQRKVRNFCVSHTHHNLHYSLELQC